MGPPTRRPLTRRQRQVAELAATMGTTAIAGQLGISGYAARSHVRANR